MRCYSFVLCLCVATGSIGSPIKAELRSIDDGERDQGSGESNSQCTRIGQNWVDFYNGFDATKVLDVFTKDIVFEDVPTGSLALGADAFRAGVQEFFNDFPVSTFELVRATCHGQQATIKWTQSFEDGRVNPPAAGYCGTGRPMTTRGVSVLEIRGGRISRDTDYWDLFSDLRQLLPENRDCVMNLLGLGTVNGAAKGAEPPLAPSDR